MVKELVFDIETTGLNALNSRITCICAKVINGSEYKGSHTNEKGLIKDFLKFVSDERLTYDDFLVSANGKDFDLPFIFIRAFMNKIDLKDVEWLNNVKHFDIINDITSKKISLNNLANIFRFELKSGDGVNAIKLFEEMKLEELMNYCMDDVLLTEKIYLKFMENNNGN